MNEPLTSGVRTPKKATMAEVVEARPEHAAEMAKLATKVYGKEALSADELRRQLQQPTVVGWIVVRGHETARWIGGFALARCSEKWVENYLLTVEADAFLERGRVLRKWLKALLEFAESRDVLAVVPTADELAIAVLGGRGEFVRGPDAPGFHHGPRTLARFERSGRRRDA